MESNVAFLNLREQQCIPLLILHSTSLQANSFAWPLEKLKYAYNRIQVHHFQNQQEELARPGQLRESNQGCLLTSSIPIAPNRSPGFTLEPFSTFQCLLNLSSPTAIRLKTTRRTTLHAFNDICENHQSNVVAQLHGRVEISI